MIGYNDRRAGSWNPGAIGESHDETDLQLLEQALGEFSPMACPSGFVNDPQKLIRLRQRCTATSTCLATGRRGGGSTGARDIPKREPESVITP